MQSPELTILVPALDEEEALPQLVAAVETLELDLELVVVLDGCTDGSFGLLERLRGAGRPWLKVLSLAANVGQHKALAAGLARSSGLYVFTLDADLQTPVDGIPLLLDMLRKGADAVGAIRRRRQDAPHRKAASMTFRLVAAVGFRRFGVSDPGCMLRGYARSVVDAFLAEDPEVHYLPFQLLRYARSYGEAELEHRARSVGTSRYNPVRLAGLFARALRATGRPSPARAHPPVAAVLGLEGEG